jgi:hypothetical protein
MKTVDSTMEEDSRSTKVLSFTCTVCGNRHVAEYSGGYASRTFVEAVVCQPANAGEETQESEKGQRCEIHYASLADGSPDCDYVEDDYGGDCAYWYACGDCEAVLKSENGSPVEDEGELAEWLMKNCPQEDSEEPEDNGTGE